MNQIKKERTILLGKNLNKAILLLTVLIMLASIVAAIPEIIPIKGKLANNTGQLLTGNYTFRFEIYDTNTSGKIPLFAETKTLYVNKGIFSTVIGDTNTTVPISTVDFNKQRWLGIFVNGEEQLPTIKIASTPSSLRTKTAYDLNIPDFNQTYYTQNDANNTLIKISDTNNNNRIKYGVIADLNNAYYTQNDLNNNGLFIKVSDTNNIGRISSTTIRDWNTTSSMAYGAIRDINKAYYTQNDLNNNGLFIKVSDTNNNSRIKYGVIADLNNAYYTQNDLNNNGLFIKVSDTNNIGRISSTTIRDWNTTSSMAYGAIRDINKAYYTQTDANNIFTKTTDTNAQFAPYNSAITDLNLGTHRLDANRTFTNQLNIGGYTPRGTLDIFTLDALDVTTATATQDNGAYSYPNDGCPHTYKFYSYKTVNGTTYYSKNAKTVNFADDFSSTYRVHLSWTKPTGVDGVRIWEDWNPCSSTCYSDQTGTDAYDNACSGWTSGTPTITPTTMGADIYLDPATGTLVSSRDINTTSTINTANMAITGTITVGAVSPTTISFTNASIANNLALTNTNTLSAGLQILKLTDAGANVWLEARVGTDPDGNTQGARILAIKGTEGQNFGTTKAYPYLRVENSRDSNGANFYWDVRQQRAVIETDKNAFSIDFNASQANFRNNVIIANPNNLGPEKINNGTFTGNTTNWALGSGWTYGDNNAYKATGTGTLSQGDANMISSFVKGKNYYLTFYIKGRSSSTFVTVSVCGNTMPRIANFLTLDSTFSYVFTCLDNTQALTFSPSTTISRFVIDNVSVKEITGGDLYVSGLVDANIALIGTAKSNGLVSGDLNVQNTIYADTIKVRVLTNVTSDPEFQLFYPSTRQRAIDLEAENTPPEKKGGMGIFFNQETNQIEIYYPTKKQFFDLQGNLLEDRSQGIMQETVSQEQTTDKNNPVIIKTNKPEPICMMANNGEYSGCALEYRPGMWTTILSFFGIEEQRDYDWVCKPRTECDKKITEMETTDPEWKQKKENARANNQTFELNWAQKIMKKLEQNASTKPENKDTNTIATENNDLNTTTENNDLNTTATENDKNTTETITDTNATNDYPEDTNNTENDTNSSVD